MDRLFSAVLIVTVVVTVFGLGLVVTLREIAGTRRHGWLLVAVLVANLVLVPLSAWASAAALGLDAAQRAGLVLISAGAGGALALKLVQLGGRAGGGGLAIALSLTVLLECTATVALPAWAAVVAPGSSVDGRSALTTVVLLVLVPLGCGQLVVRLRPASAALAPALGRAATVGLVLVIVTGVLAFRAELAAQLASWTTAAAALVSCAALGLGALAAVVAGRGAVALSTTALVTGCRFSSLGLVVIDRAFSGQDAVRAASIVAVLVLLVIPVGVALVLRRPSRSGTSAAPGALAGSSTPLP